MYFDTDKPESRKYAFRDRCSRLVELDETIKLPNKGKLLAFAYDKEAGNEVASFKGHISLEGNSLTVSEKVVLGKRVYEAGDWEMFRKVVQNQQKFAETPLIIELNQ